nr:immunoglobulin heavy chain junction region [Macaca mulatta]
CATSTLASEGFYYW